ncbi:hypothetical protein BC628DRAFT_1403048 [Trametes gibbosa]|nr:hypothetical protein BC628DRAFT_1403048 [Trametes gibbosa]
MVKGAVCAVLPSASVSTIVTVVPRDYVVRRPDILRVGTNSAPAATSAGHAKLVPFSSNGPLTTSPVRNSRALHWRFRFYSREHPCHAITVNVHCLGGLLGGETQSIKTPVTIYTQCKHTYGVSMMHWARAPVEIEIASTNKTESCILILVCRGGKCRQFSKSGSVDGTYTHVAGLSFYWFTLKIRVRGKAHTIRYIFP